MSRNFKPEARLRLMSIFGNEQGASLFDRLDRFCDIARDSGEALIVPPDLDPALHEVLSVRPCLEITSMDHMLFQGEMRHEEVRPVEPLELQHVMMEHAFMGESDAPRSTVGKTMGELVELAPFRDRAQRTLEVFEAHGFVTESGARYGAPACTVRYSQPACTVGYAAA